MFILTISIWGWFFHYEVYAVYIFLLISLYIAVTGKCIEALIPILIFLPFIESQSNILRDLPIGSFIAGGVIFLILSIRMIFTRSTVKAKLLPGIVALLLAILISGAPYDPIVGFEARVLFLLAGTGFMLLYLIFTRLISRPSYQTLSLSLFMLGLFISLQVLFHFNTFPDFWEAVRDRDLHLAWGNANSIAIALLMTIPLSVYVSTARKRNYLLFPFVFIQIFALLLTLSRGSILAFTIVIPVFLFLIIRESKNRLFTIGLLVLLIAGISYSIIAHPTIFNPIISRFLTIGFDDSGRFEIFRDGIIAFLSKPIFGNGFTLDSLQYDHIYYYHSTFIQTLANGGFIALLALVWHFDQKYLLVIKQKNHFFHWIGMVLLVTDLYGLIDVTYYTFIYMLLLGVILGVTENYASDNQRIVSTPAK